jgi:hypothetical protein
VPLYFFVPMYFFEQLLAAAGARCCCKVTTEKCNFLPYALAEPFKPLLMFLASGKDA